MELVVERSILESWGFGPPFSLAFWSLARPDLVPARVLSDLGSHLEVVDAACTGRLARLSGRMRNLLPPDQLPTVGDWVALAAPTGDHPAVIHYVLPRRSQLIRRGAGRRTQGQVIAANVDTFFIVTSANRDANARRLERYLVAVWDSGASPVLVVNKIDLVEPTALEGILAELAAVAPGVPIVAVSAHRGTHIADLDEHLQPGRTIALIGSSGVGKSSLVNSWLGADHQTVWPIDADERGRHGTTRRDLFALPGGGLVIDTPGMRAFGLLETEVGLETVFSDIAELAAGCRYRDCQHLGEPGCAVEAAIEAGDLDPDRREGLHKLERELAAAAIRRDPVLAAEERARMRSINKALRARTKVDPKLRR
jgi:ribosome biogenesis GTPase